MGRKSKADVRKKEILEHFYIILKEEGFENASIAKIANLMEVNPSLLIHYFKTKEEMVVAFVEFLLGRYEDTFKEQMLGAKDPQERFNNILDVMFSEDWLTFSDQTVFYACYYLSSRHPRIKERFQVMYNRFKELLIPHAISWMETGVIKEANPEDVVDYLIVVNEGLTYFDKLMSDPEGFKRRAKFLKSSVLKTLTS
ncbi:TetR/AcrR family transcriptional regulator [Aureispira anguillae]|uniref:Biofilm operon icaADBC HTH-type negative transcriptional regulator IcaR n=1 Tax=Aureispira anguillae TaxID=2864201 RepID=A0A915YFB2_9BACT|nr:TetR/AcrR family transcriptional regulator [Aureispira anguillae]BDS12073.1 TetR/AcrR family transcriptional regulator [Aureispira anguillae]